jgi:hypothetical protein
MTDARIVRVASRAFALYLISWALLDLTYLPQYLIAFVHHLGDTEMRGQNYWKNYYLIELASLAIRVAGALLTSLYCWNGGQRIMGLFLPANEETDAVASSQE